MAHLEYATPPVRRQRRTWVGWFAIAWTVLAVLATAVLPSMPLGVCCLVPVLFLLFLAAEDQIRRRAWTGRRAVGARVATFGLIFLGLLALRPSGARVFAEVFGADPPTGVHGIRYKMEFGGLFDQPDICMRFKVETGVMAQVVAGPQFRRYPELEAQYAAGNLRWDHFCNQALVQGGRPGGIWEPTVRSPAFEVYGIVDPADPDSFTDVGIVYDPATGEVVVHRNGY